MNQGFGVLYETVCCFYNWGLLERCKVRNSNNNKWKADGKQRFFLFNHVRVNIKNRHLIQLSVLDWGKVSASLCAAAVGDWFCICIFSSKLSIQETYQSLSQAKRWKKTRMTFHCCCSRFLFVVLEHPRQKIFFLLFSILKKIDFSLL